jgi:alpha-N-arabinofuranosidase
MHPLTHSHPTVLEVDIPVTSSASSGPVGFVNYGWWGIPVTPQTYNVSFYVYPDQVRNQNNLATSITVSLQSNLTGEVWASVVIPAQSWNVVNYTFITASIVNTVTAPDSNNSLAITFDPVAAAGQTYYFDQISLFGETFKGYPNGLRKDLAQNIYDLGPKFLRWPGGNNIHLRIVGQDRAIGVSGVHFKCWRTELTFPEYYNTNGLGLLEFLEWTEGMGMQNVLAVYSGYSLGDAAEADVCHCSLTLYETNSKYRLTSILPRTLHYIPF